MEAALYNVGGKGSMENKEYIYEPQTQKQKKKNGAWSLERVCNQKRYYDGKIFYGADRVTYTFVDDDEVVVLHFDVSRQTLFFKGHRVESLAIHSQMKEFLSSFKERLLENEQTKEFLESFEMAVAHLG
jgi:hypothetical protein